MEKLKALILKHPFAAVAIAVAAGAVFRPGLDRVTGGAISKAAGQVGKLPLVGPTLAKAVV